METLPVFWCHASTLRWKNHSQCWDSRHFISSIITATLYISVWVHVIHCQSLSLRLSLIVHCKNLLVNVTTKNQSNPLIKVKKNCSNPCYGLLRLEEAPGGTGKGGPNTQSSIKFYSCEAMITWSWWKWREQHAISCNSESLQWLLKWILALEGLLTD